MINIAQALQGVILQYTVAHATEDPFLAAWHMAFCSA